MPDKFNISRYIIESPGHHIRRSSRRHIAFSLACHDVYDCTEILEIICGLCDWNSLVQVGNTNQRLRVIVQYIVRRRVTFGLDRFMPREYHTRFFQLLEFTEAAVVGGFIRHIMCLEEEIYRVVFPSQLSIAVPTGTLGNSDNARRWIHFISNCGEYEANWDNDTSPPYSTRSSDTYLFNRTSCNIQISIIVCEDDNIVSTLVYAPETSLFNVLTSRRIYSFYPSLFTRRISLETSTIRLSSRLRDSICPFRFGFTTYDDTSVAHLLHPCKEGCYALTRNVLRMEGISRFRWGGILGEHDQDDFYGDCSPSDPFMALDIEWRIGSRCRNVACKFYRLGFLE